MLMAIKIKELNIFPVLHILISSIMEDEEEVKYLRQPKTYYYHLKLLIEKARFGRNILQNFIESELTHEGMDWLAGKLLAADRRFLKDCSRVLKLGDKQDMHPGSL